MKNKKMLRFLDKQWTEQVKKRDENICQVCGSKSKMLNAHHIIPKSYNETRHDLNNGITLCFKCHKVGKNGAHMNAIWFTLFLCQNKTSQFDYLIKKVVELS